jgi:hypothetical protein
MRAMIHYEEIKSLDRVGDCAIRHTPYTIMAFNIDLHRWASVSLMTYDTYWPFPLINILYPSCVIEEERTFISHNPHVFVDSLPRGETPFQVNVTLYFLKHQSTSLCTTSPSLPSLVYYFTSTMDFALSLDTFPVVDSVDIQMSDAFFYQHDKDSFVFDRHDSLHQHDSLPHHDSLHQHDVVHSVSDVSDGDDNSSWENVYDSFDLGMEEVQDSLNSTCTRDTTSNDDNSAFAHELAASIQNLAEFMKRSRETRTSLTAVADDSERVKQTVHKVEASTECIQQYLQDASLTINQRVATGA